MADDGAGGREKTTSADMMQALAKRHPPAHWLLVDEVRLPGALGEQRIDAVAMSYWPSEQHVRHAYEVKISRGDFLREIAAPEKRAYGMASAEHFWFALAAGVARPEEVPQVAGILVMAEDGELAQVRAAPHRAVEPPSVSLMLAMARRAEAAGRRSAAASAGQPFQAPLMRVLDCVTAPGALHDVLAAHVANLAQALRGAGQADAAREVERRLRDARHENQAYRSAERGAILATLAAQHPVPPTCPACSYGVPVRCEQNLFMAECPACGHRENLLRPPTRRRRAGAD